jgi:DnaJ domain
MAQTYYEILGVEENAAPAEIEAAFKAKAREVHPDTVPVGNTYLRKVAAEAFKDLSEAKATLLDPIARQKYDAGLVYARTTTESHASPSGSERSGGDPGSAPSSSQASARSQKSSRSRTSPRTPGTPGLSQGARKGIAPLPDIKNLNSFLFMILGIAAIFFLVVLVSSGRMPPLWLAALTACLGILSFVNGMRPHATTISSKRTTLILSAILVAGVLFSLWLFSPSYIEIATSSGHAGASAASLARAKAPRRSGASHGTANGATVAVVDESGADAALPTKIWTNLKDGQNYRTRVNGDTLNLDAIGSAAKSAGQLSSCEFHRASIDTPDASIDMPSAGKNAPDWSGICSEPDPQSGIERKTSATLSHFSDARLEGSTTDIPLFLMTPVETVQMGKPPATATEVTPQIAPQGASEVAPQVGPPAEGESVAERDLSKLGGTEKQSIETACTSNKLLEGPAKYDECVQAQLDALKKSPRPGGLSKLSSADRDAVEFACTDAKLMQGPAAYNKCLAQQMAIVKRKQKP